MTKILVIGQNPAKSSTTNAPFLGTKSGVKLVSWLEKAGVEHYTLANLVNYKTKNNQPLKKSQLNSLAYSDAFYSRLSQYDKVIAVGSQAYYTVGLARLRHMMLPNLQVLHAPHPSGLNRQLNVPGAEAKVIRSIREFVKS